MASQRLQRYISVLKAKGIEPDALTMAKMMREDAAAGMPQSTASTTSPTDTRQNRRELLNITPSEMGDVSGDPPEAQTLGVVAGGLMAAPGFAKSGTVSLAKGALTAATIPSAVPAKTAIVVGSMIPGPIALAMAVNRGIGTGMSGNLIGMDMANMFGEEAAQEAASVLSGRAELDSVSMKGQAAFHNAKIAMENMPRHLTKHLFDSLTTDKTTDENIESTFALEAEDEALQMSIQSAMNSGRFNGPGSGVTGPGGSMGPPGTPGSAGMDAGPDSGGSSSGIGGGNSGIGPGQR